MSTSWQNRHSSVVTSDGYEDVKFRNFPSFTAQIVFDFLRYMFLETQSKHHCGIIAGIHAKRSMLL